MNNLRKGLVVGGLAALVGLSSVPSNAMMCQAPKYDLSKADSVKIEKTTRTYYFDRNNDQYQDMIIQFGNGGDPKTTKIEIDEDFDKIFENTYFLKNGECYMEVSSYFPAEKAGRSI